VILYVIGIPFIAGVRNIAALYYAYNDSKTPMYASFAAVAVNIILNLSLMHIIGFRAFPLATTLSAVANITILFLFIDKKVTAVPISSLLAFYGRLIIPSIAAGCGGLILNHVVSAYIGTSLIIQCANIAISGILALCLFYGGCLVFGISDARNYIKRLIKR